MLKHYTIFVAICTFFLLIAGGMVTSTGSGLAVPDWPLSYGQVMPPMVGGIFYEHGHRMVATFVGFLTVLLVIFILRTEERRWVRLTALAALGAVIVQGLLGGLTVILLLPTIVSAGHATLGQSFFCLVIALAFVQSEWWKQERGATFGREISRGRLWIPVFFVLIQLVLGALMRHSQAGTIVPDFPLAYGTVFPSLSDESLRGYTDLLVRKDLWLWANGQVTGWQVVIHLLHRYWGLFLAVYLYWHAFRVYRNPAPDGRLRLLASVTAVTVSIQIALGILTVLMGRPVWAATAHQSVGAVVLGVVFLTSLHQGRLKYYATGHSVITTTALLKTN